MQVSSSNRKQECHDGPESLTWENLNQMLHVDIYITKIWPSEQLFYPIQPIEF